MDPDVFEVIDEPVAEPLALESKFEPISDLDSKPLFDDTLLLRRVSIRLPNAEPALLLESSAEPPTVLPIAEPVPDALESAEQKKVWEEVGMTM